MISPAWRCACSLALATCLSTAAVAAELASTQSHLSAVDLFDLAGQSVSAGRVDEALKLYDALGHDPDLEIRSEARFREGQLLASLHRDRQAAKTYRRLLDEKPNASRVRLELAGVLARLGDEPGARGQIRLAQAAGLPPEVAEQVTQFSRALRSPKRFGGAFELTLAPDTNINRSTQARTLDTVIAPLFLDEDARARSGIGLRTRASAFAKQPLTDRFAAVARASGSADLYRRGQYDDIIGAASLGIEWRGERDQASTSYGFSMRWYDRAPFADTRTVSVEWLHQLDRTSQLTSTISLSRVHYDRNALQDGQLYDASSTLERALSARTGLGVGADVTRQDARDPSYASTGYGPLMYAWHDRGRATFFLSATVKRLVGDERNFLFTDKRREWFAAGRIGATFRQISVAGLSPTVRIGYERNYSTIAVYDYRRIYGEVGLSRSF